MPKFESIEKKEMSVEQAQKIFETLVYDEESYKRELALGDEVEASNSTKAQYLSMAAAVLFAWSEFCERGLSVFVAEPISRLPDIDLKDGRSVFKGAQKLEKAAEIFSRLDKQDRNI